MLDGGEKVETCCGTRLTKMQVFLSKKRAGTPGNIQRSFWRNGCSSLDAKLLRMFITRSVTALPIAMKATKGIAPLRN